MNKYEVGLAFDAGNSVMISAESPEEAASMACGMDESSPTIRHYCASDFNLGDCAGVTVFENDDEVYTDIPHYTLMSNMAEKIKHLERELHEYKSLCSQLQEELKEAGLL